MKFVPWNMLMCVLLECSNRGWGEGVLNLGTKSVVDTSKRDDSSINTGYMKHESTLHDVSCAHTLPEVALKWQS